MCVWRAGLVGVFWAAARMDGMLAWVCDVWTDGRCLDWVLRLGSHGGDSM